MVYNLCIMKKTIIIEILMLLSICVLIASAIKFCTLAHLQATNIERWTNLYNQIPVQSEDWSVVSRRIEALTTINELKKLYSSYIVYAIFALLAAVADLAAMVLVALRDIPALREKLAARKTRRAEQKAEQAAIDKQERIERLQAELEELKKDE